MNWIKSRLKQPSTKIGLVVVVVTLVNVLLGTNIDASTVSSVLMGSGLVAVDA